MDSDCERLAFLLAQAFSEAHAAAPMLVESVRACRAYVEKRKLL